MFRLKLNLGQETLYSDPIDDIKLRRYSELVAHKNILLTSVGFSIQIQENFIPNESKTVNRNENAEEFIKKVVNGLNELDPEFAEIVERDFWNLI